MTAPVIRQQLADVVTSWIALKHARGFSRVVAKNQHEAALAELSIALAGLDEPLAGALWSHAYRVATLWAQGLSIKRAMRKLIDTYAKVVNDGEDMAGDVRDYARLQSLELRTS